MATTTTALLLLPSSASLHSRNSLTNFWNSLAVLNSVCGSDLLACCCCCCPFTMSDCTLCVVVVSCGKIAAMLAGCLLWREEIRGKFSKLESFVRRVLDFQPSPQYANCGWWSWTYFLDASVKLNIRVMLNCYCVWRRIVAYPLQVPGLDIWISNFTWFSIICTNIGAGMHIWISSAMEFLCIVLASLAQLFEHQSVIFRGPWLLSNVMQGHLPHYKIFTGGKSLIISGKANIRGLYTGYLET